MLVLRVALPSLGTHESFARQFGPRSCCCCYCSVCSKTGVLWVFFLQAREARKRLQVPSIFFFLRPHALGLAGVHNACDFDEGGTVANSLSNAREKRGYEVRLLFLFLFHVSLLTTKWTFSKENWNKITFAIHEGINNFGITKVNVPFYLYFTTENNKYSCYL